MTGELLLFWCASILAISSLCEASGPDCGKCAAISKDIQSDTVASSQASAKLEQQRRALKALREDQTALKMKMTSNLFVLAAELETSQNQRQLKQNEWAYNCRSCGSAGAVPEKKARKSSKKPKQASPEKVDDAE